MKNRSVICAAALLSLAAAGCTPKGSDAGRDTSGAQPPRIIVTVLAGQSTSDAGTEEMINDTLRSKAPNIDLEWERVDWGEQFEAQMQAKFASGEVPDVMIGKAQDVETYVPTGNLASFPASLVQHIRRAALTAVTVRGNVYGLPYNALYQGVFYSKSIFDQFGLRPPTTQSELNKVVETLKANHVVPYAAHFEENWYVGNIAMQFAIGDVFSREPDWGDRFRKNQVSFSSSDAFRACYAYAKEILDDSWPDAFSISQTESDERFANGKAAMYVTGSWTLQTINAVNPRMRVGVFPFPNQTGDAKLIFEPNMTFMKSSKSDHGDAVDRVLQAVFDSRDLASEILDYTKTSSMLKNIEPDVPLLIQPDIDRYSESAMITDATIGNTQLIWSFQEEIANRLDDWLQNKASLQSVLDYADQNRSLSAP